VYYPPKTAEGAVPHINRYRSEVSSISATLQSRKMFSISQALSRN